MNRVLDETPVFGHGTPSSEGDILSYALHLKKEGYSPDTSKNRVKVLHRLAKHCGTLIDGEKVKEDLANPSAKGSTKLSIANAYLYFARWRGISGKSLGYITQNQTRSHSWGWWEALNLPSHAQGECGQDAGNCGI